MDVDRKISLSKRFVIRKTYLEALGGFKLHMRGFHLQVEQMTTTCRISRDRVQVPTGNLKDLQVFGKADADDRPLEISPFEDCLTLRNACQT